MIPISKDQLLTKEIDEVTYFFHPPLGDFEIKLINIFDQSVISEGISIKVAYGVVEKEMEKEYKGKRKPGKKEWEKLITDRIGDRIKGESSMSNDIENINSVIDLSLCNWKSSNENVPKFPEGDKPSSMLMITLKRTLYDWYLGHFTLTGEEVKN